MSHQLTTLTRLCSLSTMSAAALAGALSVVSIRYTVTALPLAATKNTGTPRLPRRALTIESRKRRLGAWQPMWQPLSARQSVDTLHARVAAAAAHRRILQLYLAPAACSRKRNGHRTCASCRRSTHLVAPSGIAPLFYTRLADHASVLHARLSSQAPHGRHLRLNPCVCTLVTLVSAAIAAAA